jgi:hypothetical protein
VEVLGPHPEKAFCPVGLFSDYTKGPLPEEAQEPYPEKACAGAASVMRRQRRCPEPERKSGMAYLVISGVIHHSRVQDTPLLKRGAFLYSPSGRPLIRS